jgi:hypothetical protein
METEQWELCTASLTMNGYYRMAMETSFLTVSIEAAAVFRQPTPERSAFHDGLLPVSRRLLYFWDYFSHVHTCLSLMSISH